MKFAVRRLLVLLVCVGIASASPAPMDTVQLLSLGQMNDVIGALVNRTDAESYHLLSRAYYATEQWDAAISNGEHAVNLKDGDSNFHLWLGRAYGRKAADIGNPLKAASLAHKAKNTAEVSLDGPLLKLTARFLSGSG